MMVFNLDFKKNRKFRLYGNPPELPPVVPPAVPPTLPAGFPKNQDELNALLANNRRSQAEELKKTVAMLEEMKAAKGTTEAQAAEFQQRIDQLSNQNLTDKERYEKQLATLQKTSKEAIDAATAEAKSAKGAYEKLLVTNALTKGASTHKAASEEQIIDMYGSKAKVVPVLDDTGKPTGELQVMLPVPVTKNKKTEIVDMPAIEAIGILREDPRNANLFLVDGKPGLGGGPAGHPTKGKADYTQMSMDEYLKHRKENPI